MNQVEKRKFIISYCENETDEKLDFIESLPQAQLLTLLNLGTQGLSNQASLHKTIAKDIPEAKTLEVERLCIKGDLPTTVMLPTLSQRILSVKFTALLYLTITRQLRAYQAKRIVNYALSKDQFSDFIQSVLYDCEHGNTGNLESILFINTDYFVFAFLLLSLSELDTTEHLLALWNTFQSIFGYKEPSEQMIAARNCVRSKSVSLNAGKNIEAINSAWLTSEDYLKENHVPSVPALLVCKSAFTGGISPASFAGPDVSVTKAEIINSIDNALYAQRAWNSDYIEQYSKEKMLRADTEKACIIALQLNKFARQCSRIVLGQLEQAMFGDSENQKLLDKSIGQNQTIMTEYKRLLDVVKEKNEELNKERDLRENAKKREYALKQKLEETERIVAEQRTLLNGFRQEEIPEQNDEEAIQAAMSEAGFEIEDASGKRVEEFSQKYKIVIAGGNENLMKRFRQVHPSITVINDKQIASCRELIQNADYVFLKVDCMSHSLYAKCKNIAQSNGVPVVHMPEITSISMIEEFIREKMEKEYMTVKSTEGRMRAHDTTVQFV